MVNFLAMPEYKVSNPFDVSPLYNALDSNQRLGQQQRQFDAQNKLQQAQLGIQQERLGMEKQTHAAQQHQIMAQRVGGMAQMGLNEKDPARRQAILDRIISLHPDKTNLGPEYLSPDTAFPMLIREAEGFRSRESDAKLGLIGAQTTLAQAQAQKARTEAAMGGETPSNIREWQAFQRMTPEQQQQYLTMKRANPYLNTGTAFVQPNLVQPGTVQGSIPIDVAGKEAAKAAGKFEGGAEQRNQGKARLDTLLGGLAQDYMTLNQSGGIVNPDKGTMDNLTARARSSGLGQTVAGAMGSKEQSIRQQINNSRPLLIQGIMQATGMSARALDSNKELEFYLQAVTNPQSDLHSNLVAIDAIDKTYGLGGVLKRTLPPELYERVSRDAQLALARRPIAPPMPQSGPPAGGGWSIQRVD